jgi:hypothetical protein
MTTKVNFSNPAKVRILTLLFAWLISAPCFGQSIQFSAEPLSIEGKLKGYNVLEQLPDVTTRIESSADFPGKFVAARPSQELKNAAQRNVEALSLPKTTSQVFTVENSLSAIVTFLPPDTFDESSCGGNRFADGGLAVTANFLLEVGSSCVKVLNPTTGAVITGPKSLGSFFGSSSRTSNARALYDPVNNRFLLSAADYNSNTFLLAASQSSDPTQGWNIYSFPMAGTCSTGVGDNPNLGQTYLEPGDSEGAIYLSWDIYCPPNGPTNFVGAISKTLAYSGAAITTVNGFQGLSVGGVNVDGVQPANVMNPGDRPRGEFLMNSYNLRFGGGSCVNGCNGVVVWDFYNGIPASGAAQSITATEVPTANTYYLPSNAPEPGCAVNACGPNTGGTSMGGQVNYSAGSLFGALNDSMGILTVELEPEVNDSGAITGALLRNEICFACGGFTNGGQAYDGAIQPDSERNWVMVYNYSAPGTAGCTPDPNTCIYPSTAFATRRVTQAQNTIDNNGTILALGQAYYSQVNPQGQNRWNYYSAVGANYTIPNSFWFYGEFVESNGNWGSAVGQAAYTSVTQP